MLEQTFEELNTISIVGESVSRVSDWAWQQSLDSEVAVRFIRGKKSQDRVACFNEFSASLQFPYYFGENWDHLRIA